MNKRGFTLVELLAVIVILGIILAIAVPGITGIIKNSTKGAFESDAKMVIKAIEYKKLENETFDYLTITKENMKEKIGISDDKYAQVVLSNVGDSIKIILVGANKFDGLTAYGTIKNMIVVNSDSYDEVPPIITILGDNPATAIAGIPYDDAGATALDLKDGNLTANIVRTGTVDTNTLGTYTITYTVSDNGGNEAIATRTVNVTKEGNKPVLATGMTPIKWNGSSWVDTTENDVNWYSYTTVDKQWANAKTADGSMWVWIPRYVYKISTGWHTNTAGTIDVKFSAALDDTRGGTITLDNGSTSNASNNKWTNHPAFTFGTTELTGIWVAKFEASNDGSNNVKIIPNVTSWRSITVNNIFTKVRSMETNSIYGWGTSGSDVDTHMTKNIEWGAIAYLSRSVYGKNAEISINSDVNYYTGGGTSNAYVTNVGQSTTGNVYGIYDMNGAAAEFTSSYVNNGHANLSTYGNSIISENAKYKNVYSVGSPDSELNNYNLSLSSKGDAIYEISSTSPGTTSWNNAYSYMPTAEYPWLFRGGTYYPGIFNFGYQTGNARGDIGFRAILLVGEGL